MINNNIEVKSEFCEKNNTDKFVINKINKSVATFLNMSNYIKMDQP